MKQSLDELRRMIAEVDAEIVAALVKRSGHGCQPTLYTLASRGGVAPAGCDEASLVGRVRGDYATRIAAALCDAPGAASEACACLELDQTIAHAVARRLVLSVAVGQAKERTDSATFAALRQARDARGLEAAITLPDVENQVMERIRGLSAQAHASEALAARIAAIYRDWLIPFSRQIQVEALLVPR